MKCEEDHNVLSIVFLVSCVLRSLLFDNDRQSRSKLNRYDHGISGPRKILAKEFLQTHPR